MDVLGDLYRRGLGMEKNMKKAANYYHSQLCLGVCYCNGDGVPQSYNQVRFWWIKADTQQESLDVAKEAKFHLRELSRHCL